MPRIRVLVPTVLVLATFVLAPTLCQAQVSGNLGYSESHAKERAKLRERGKRVLPQTELPPTSTTTFVEAEVMMNVKADEYVAVFGVAQEGATTEECAQKLDSTVRQFTDALRPLGINKPELHVDFISQTKIYGFEVAGDTAREKLVGFELKKNVHIRYTEPALLDKMIAAAARLQIYDLIKVDYIVKEVQPIQDMLMDEAAKIVQKKSSRYEKLLGIKLVPPAQIYAERYATHYPTEMYDSFVAAESSNVDSNVERNQRTVVRARKSRTFVFNGLDADGFDHVINPVVVEPMVQFTLYLKVKYEVEPVKAN